MRVVPLERHLLFAAQTPNKIKIDEVSKFKALLHFGCHDALAVEAMVQESPDREVPTVQVGEFLMERLRELDKVAFVRFASVYRDFKDVGEFHSELESLLNTKDDKAKPVKAKHSALE